MAALRSVDRDIAIDAAWRREWDRRIRNNNVCNVCGNTRDGCVCADQRENYAPSSGDTDPEGPVAA